MTHISTNIDGGEDKVGIEKQVVEGLLVE